MSTVCVIVVSHDQQPQLAECLSALTSQSRPPDELIIVDNASSDGSPEMVRRQFPQSRLMALNQSAGTAAAVNLAIDETSAEIVAIVLPGFVAETGWLEAILEADQPEWGCWASLIVTAAGRVHSAGLGMTTVGRPIYHGRSREPSGYAADREVFGCCYPALCYRRSMLVDILGFDSDFFREIDDVDVAFRGQLRNHRCLFVAGAVGRIDDPAGRPEAREVFFQERNSVFVYWQNMPAARLLISLPERILYQAGVAGARIVQLRTWSWLRGKANAARNLGKLLKKRSRVQAGRSVDNRLLRSRLTRNWLSKG